MSEPTPIMTRLKTETRPMHDATEEASFQSSISDGTLSERRFVDSIEQLLLIHQRFDERLRELREKSDRASNVLKDHHFLVSDRARQDLAHYGRDTENIEPNAGTREFLDRIEHWYTTDPEALLGMFYVMEGSLNGAKMIGRRLREIFDIKGEAGLRHMDPHGADQRPRWIAFVEDMNAQDWPAETEENMVRAAGDAFRAVGKMYAEIPAQD